MDDAAGLLEGTQMATRDGAYLDERRWDEWLDLYTVDCEFWMPTWIRAEDVATDPQTQLSHIYYASRAGLEDRVKRLRARRSPASTPLPRTCHVLGNVLLTDPPTESRIALRASWNCHVFSPRDAGISVFFGRSELELVRIDAGWRIRRKKVVLLNDYIPTMLDFYCV